MHRRSPLERNPGLLLLVLYALFFLWQTPSLWQAPLTPEETEGYLARLQTNMLASDEDKAVFVQDLRAWAASDDGQPVFMVNLLRYNAELKSWPGSPDFSATPTPQLANQHYELSLAPLALRMGVYPIYNSEVQGPNLIDHAPGADHWDRAQVMRFPSRRVFLEWASDPRFGQLFPYKLAAVHIALVPTSAVLVLGDLRLWLAALMLIFYLLVGRCWDRRHLKRQRESRHV